MSAISCSGSNSVVKQRRGAAGNRALLAKFASTEERTAHFRQLGKQSQVGRVTLRADDAVALREAFALLAHITGKLPTLPDVREDGA